MAVPQEILQLICEYVGRSDLKSVRLACKELNDAAEISLFRHIYLRRNMDSFCRLRMIVCTPHLAKIVKGIAYSGKMLHCYLEDPNFDEWYREHLGDGLYTRGGKYRDLVKDSLTMETVHRLYSKYCGHLHSQRLMERYGIEEGDLDYVFRKLPHLEEICFGPRASEPPFTAKEITLEHFSSLGREMLVEPGHSDGGRYHVGQFTAMMKAAGKNEKRLKVIKVLHQEWEVFEQHSEVLDTMIANMRHCEHFRVIVASGIRVDGEVQVGLMIHKKHHIFR